MRSLVLLMVFAGASSAHAEEPLFLRIRPDEARPAEIGGGGTASPEEAARQAFAAREAVWERSRVRAAIAIASICRGCLREAAPPATVAEPLAESRPQAAVVPSSVAVASLHPSPHDRPVLPLRASPSQEGHSATGIPALVHPIR